MYFILLYDYADNAVERRAPFREMHLKLAREFQERGELLLGGAFADPVDGAALVFRAGDAKVVEGFVSRDPYVASGLVTAWRIRPWTVVVGVHAAG
ncbi:MAG: YciI-like protein [Vicinamibacteria bacterium]